MTAWTEPSFLTALEPAFLFTLLLLVFICCANKNDFIPKTLTFIFSIIKFFPIGMSSGTRKK